MAAISKHLADRFPTLKAATLVAELVPPREFSNASFENYFPDDTFQSQQATKDFLIDWAGKSRGAKAPGVYLDGGFGVGKTHLLAATFHSFRGKRKAFGSFMAYTALVGALGFAPALRALKGFDLLAIDEFELDDPGNTMIMSRLINELSAEGVRFAVTSNTPPNALGEGRFAAADFQREILGIGRAFEVLRVDGLDYRHRDFDKVHVSFSETELQSWVADTGTIDDFAVLLKKLSSVHPSLYTQLLEGLERCAFLNVERFTDQNAALLFVSFVDRAYELRVELRSSGIPLTDLFPAEYLEGGYAKKYLRAISRLGALVELSD